MAWSITKVSIRYPLVVSIPWSFGWLMSTAQGTACGLGRNPMLALQILNMLNICLVGYGKAYCLEATNAKLHTIERLDLGCLRGDVIDELQETENPGRHISLERRIACKNHSCPVRRRL